MYELVVYDEQGDPTVHEMSATTREILIRNEIIEQANEGISSDYYVLHVGLSEPWRTIIKALLNLGNNDDN